MVNSRNRPSTQGNPSSSPGVASAVCRKNRLQRAVALRMQQLGTSGRTRRNPAVRIEYTPSRPFASPPCRQAAAIVAGQSNAPGLKARRKIASVHIEAAFDTLAPSSVTAPSRNPRRAFCPAESAPFICSTSRPSSITSRRCRRRHRLGNRRAARSPADGKASPYPVRRRSIGQIMRIRARNQKYHLHLCGNRRQIPACLMDLTIPSYATPG